MKFQKFLNCFGCVTMAAAVVVAAVAIPERKTQPVSAAVVDSTAFAEDFSTKTTSAKWEKNDFSLAKDSYYSLRINQHSTYGGIIAYKGYEIDGSCEIRFDLRYTETEESASSDWFGVMFGLTEESSHFVYSTAVVNCKKTLVQLMDDGDGEKEKIVANSYNDHAKFSDSFVGAASKEQITVSINLSYTGKRTLDDANLYKIDGYYWAIDGERPSLPSFYYENVACDGWFGFSGMSKSIVDISNLQVFERETVVAQDNFETADGEGKRFVGAKSDENWKSISYKESAVYAYYNGRMEAGKANGEMVSDFYVDVDTRCEKPFTFNVETEFSALPTGSCFGFSFGLTETTDGLGDGCFIGLQGEENGRFSVVYKKNGEVVKQSQPMSLSFLQVERVLSLQFDGFYDDSGVFTVNGYTFAVENFAVNGKFAIGTLGTVAPEIFFDNVQIIDRYYTASYAANKAIDFSGLRETVDGEDVYVDRYINEREWFIGSNVSLPKIYRAKDKYIQFVTSSTASFFGPKAIYSEFICRFTLTVIQNGKDTDENTSIGLSFGKVARNDVATECPTVAFVKTAGGMILKGYHCSLRGGDGSATFKQYETYPELNFWSSENWEKSPVTYRVMMVVRGGKAYVYYANAASPDSEMGVCRAVFEGMETYGCVTLSAWGGASFRLLDFAITNIAV